MYTYRILAIFQADPNHFPFKLTDHILFNVLANIIHLNRMHKSFISLQHTAVTTFSFVSKHDSLWKMFSLLESLRLGWSV